MLVNELLMTSLTGIFHFKIHTLYNEISKSLEVGGDQKYKFASVQVHRTVARKAGDYLYNRLPR